MFLFQAMGRGAVRYLVMLALFLAGMGILLIAFPEFFAFIALKRYANHRFFVEIFCAREASKFSEAGKKYFGTGRPTERKRL